MFTRKDVRGWPYDIKDKIVTFRYSRTSNSNKFAEVQMHLFERNEMKKMVEDEGFERIEVFSDLNIEKKDFSKNQIFLHKLHISQ